MIDGGTYNNEFWERMKEVQDVKQSTYLMSNEAASTTLPSNLRFVIVGTEETFSQETLTPKITFKN